MKRTGTPCAGAQNKQGSQLPPSPPPLGTPLDYFKLAMGAVGSLSTTQGSLTHWSPPGDVTPGGWIGIILVSIRGPPLDMGGRGLEFSPGHFLLFHKGGGKLYFFSIFIFFFFHHAFDLFHPFFPQKYLFKKNSMPHSSILTVIVMVRYSSCTAIENAAGKIMVLFLTQSIYPSPHRCNLI